MEGIEGPQLPAVEGDCHVSLPVLPAGEEPVEHELDVPRCLVELADEIPSISSSVGTDEAVEFLADDERSADREAVGPRDRCDTLGKFEDPLVSYRDRIQLPDRTGRHIPQWTGQIPPFVDTVGISV